MRDDLQQWKWQTANGRGIMKQQGMSLLQVLVMLVLLSAALIASDKYQRMQHRQQALAFTLAQSSLLLNHAVAYRRQSGQWKHTGTACRLVLAQTVANGFGQPVSCYFPDASAANLGERWGLVQWVPPGYDDLVSQHFDAGDVRSYSGARPAAVSSGYVGLAILTHASGVRGRALDFAAFGGAGLPSADRLRCEAGEESVRFAALGSYCAHVHRQATLRGWALPGGCQSQVAPSHPLAYNGVRYELSLTSGAVRASYAQFRRDVVGITDEPYDESMSLLGCAPPNHNQNTYLAVAADESEDGVANADTQCQDQPVTAAIFQVCR